MEIYKEEEEEYEYELRIKTFQQRTGEEAKEDIDQHMFLVSFFEKLNDDQQILSCDEKFQDLFFFFSQPNCLDDPLNVDEMLISAITIFLPFLNLTPCDFTSSFFLSLMKMKKRFSSSELEFYHLNINELAIFDYLLKYSDLETSFEFYKAEFHNNIPADTILINSIIHTSHPNYFSFQIIIPFLDIQQFRPKLISFIRDNSGDLIEACGMLDELTFNEVYVLFDLFSHVSIQDIINDFQIEQLLNGIYDWWKERQSILLEDTESIQVIVEKVFEILYQCCCIDTNLITFEDVEGFLSSYTNILDPEEDGE